MFIAFDDNYNVTEDGRVYSNRSKKWLKPGLSSSGYLTVCLGRNNSKGLHELVLETHIGPRPGEHVCNHKDGDKLNNHVSNLEWVTYSDNLKHAYERGLRKGRSK